MSASKAFYFPRCFVVRLIQTKRRVIFGDSGVKRNEDRDPIDNAIINKTENIQEVANVIGNYKITYSENPSASHSKNKLYK
jgi:hypothetical protein